ncbi:MAG: PilW family protein [Burkholderiales bacterium]|nr:PilW family protein [Burkholderiales bacterium]
MKAHPTSGRTPAGGRRDAARRGASRPRGGARLQRGAGLVEIMVGVTIGLLALLIIYQALALSEGYKRTTQAGGDAQSSGMIASFLLAQDLGNAGNTMAESAVETTRCPNTGNFATTWRPIPALIRDGGADNVSDSFDVFYGVNPVLVTPVKTIVTATPGNDIVVQSPIGWAANQTFLITDQQGACEIGTVQQVVLDPAPYVTTTTGILAVRPQAPIAGTYGQGPSRLVSLGVNPQKVRFDLAGDTLRRQDLMTGAAPVPIASNIMLMKAQYGLDTDGDRFIDTWASARDAPWREADVLAAPLGQLRQIKAVRFALVVRSSQFERQFDAEGRDVATAATITADLTIPSIFPCNGLVPCTGEMTLVNLPGTAGFRYRIFEQVVPLRNQIWNPA